MAPSSAKAPWRDKVCVERLWCRVKYKEVYLPAYNGVSEARTSLGRCLFDQTSHCCPFLSERNPGRTPFVKAENMFIRPEPFSSSGGTYFVYAVWRIASVV